MNRLPQCRVLQSARPLRFSRTNPSQKLVRRSSRTIVLNSSFRNWCRPILCALPAQAKPVSLVGEADGEQQHTQRQETKHPITLALLADAVQENLRDAEGENNQSLPAQKRTPPEKSDRHENCTINHAPGAIAPARGNRAALQLTIPAAEVTKKACSAEPVMMNLQADSHQYREAESNGRKSRQVVPTAKKRAPAPPKLRPVTIANTAAPARLVAKCMLVTTANGCGVPVIQSTRRERPATVNTEVAKNLSAAFARLGPGQPEPAIRPTNTGSPSCRRTPAARPRSQKRWPRPTLVEERIAGRRRRGCHQEASPGEGNRNPGASGMLSPGFEKHHQRNPGRGRIDDRKGDEKSKRRQRIRLRAKSEKAPQQKERRRAPERKP